MIERVMIERGIAAKVVISLFYREYKICRFLNINQTRKLVCNRFIRSGMY